MKTYSLAEFAEMALPPDLVDPERWLRRRLNNGTLRGYRAGRTWRITQDQLDYNFETLSNTKRQPDSPTVEPPRPAEPVSILAGMSERGRARVLQQQNSSQDRRMA